MYKEALERAKEIKSKILSSHLSTESCKAVSEYIDTIIPELAGSEDERIRKFLINILSHGTWRKEWPFGPNEVVAYLEKRKEQKPEQYSPLCDTIKDKIREYIANHFIADTVVKTDIKSIVKAMEEGVRLGKEEQKPAEWSEDKFPKDIEKDATQFCFDNGINITPHQAKQIAIHYLMVGHNEGYVEGRKNAHIPARELGLPSSMDFKQEWSEEDEEMRNLIVAIFEVNHPDGFFKANELGTTDMRGVHTEEIISWLKSLSSNLKKKNEDVAKLCSNEWSKEDEKRVKQLIYDTEAIRAGYEKRKESLGDDFNDELIKDCDEQINWLKSLRPSWKPSEEHLSALLAVFNDPDNIGSQTCQLALTDLYEQLKKL